MIRNIFRIENNQEIKIYPEQIKKGDVIKVVYNDKDNEEKVKLFVESHIYKALCNDGVFRKMVNVAMEGSDKQLQLLI